jgi:hypothetical protein
LQRRDLLSCIFRDAWFGLVEWICDGSPTIGMLFAGPVQSARVFNTTLGSYIRRHI